MSVHPVEHSESLKHTTKSEGMPETCFLIGCKHVPCSWAIGDRATTSVILII